MISITKRIKLTEQQQNLLLDLINDRLLDLPEDDAVYMKIVCWEIEMGDKVRFTNHMLEITKQLIRDYLNSAKCNRPIIASNLLELLIQE